MSVRSVLSILLSALLAVPLSAQEAAVPKALNLVIVEGDGAINNARQRVAREPIVQVTDENNRPLAGVAVVFLLPSSGPGAAFPNGATSFTAITGPDGKAVANGLRANSLKGSYQMRVTASYKGLTASQSIAMANAAGAAIGSTALWAIILLAGAGAAAGIALGVNSGANATPTKPPVSVTPGTPVVTIPR